MLSSCIAGTRSLAARALLFLALVACGGDGDEEPVGTETEVASVRLVASGQLGNGSTAQPTGAVEVQRGALQLEHVVAGAAHSCALTTDGAAYCWGANAFGRLGDGTTSASLVPVAVRRAP